MMNVSDNFGCMTKFCGTPQAIAYSSAHSILALIALLGNVWVIVALQKVSSLHPPSKLLLCCLACTDLCVGMITQPLHVVLLVLPEDSQAQNYIFNVFNSLATIFAGVSLLTLTAISVDRLLALQMGLRYRQVVTLRRAWIFVAVFWIFSITIAMTFFFNFRITIFIISIATFFCIVTSTLCYTKIYVTLRNHQAQVQDTVHQGQANRGGTSLNIERYKKTVSSALWLQITLAVCYLPYTIVAIIFAIAETHTQLLGLCLEAALTLVLFNSSLNPFLYCWKMKEVRQVVKVMVRNFSCFSCQL